MPDLYKWLKAERKVLDLTLCSFLYTSSLTSDVAAIDALLIVAVYTDPHHQLNSCSY